LLINGAFEARHRASATDAGQRLLQQLRPAIDQIAHALENLNQERLRPLGWLRIYATSHLVATAVVVPIWDRFLSIRAAPNAMYCDRLR
jgi:DNA-binding transcriptional LysR family regulator